MVDAKYVEEMDVIESDFPAVFDLTMADDTKRRARELYSILVSFMRGRPAKLARSITDQNGYEVWRNGVLNATFQQTAPIGAGCATFHGPLRPGQVALRAGDPLRLSPSTRGYHP